MHAVHPVQRRVSTTSLYRSRHCVVSAFGILGAGYSGCSYQMLRFRCCGSDAAVQMLKDSPQAHPWTAWGLLTLSPPPRSAVSNSGVEPETMGTLFGSITTRTSS